MSDKENEVKQETTAKENDQELVKDQTEKAQEEEKEQSAVPTASEKLEEEAEDSGLSPAPFHERIIVVTSGKGGVGKTTSSAAIATGLALKGHKTAVIDFDVGLRNLDLIMGCERRVVYDLT